VSLVGNIGDTMGDNATSICSPSLFAEPAVEWVMTLEPTYNIDGGRMKKPCLWL